MPLLRPGVRRLLRLRSSATSGHGPASEVDEEVQHHLERRAEQLLAQGFSRATAEREALRLFGESRATLQSLYSVAGDRDRYMRTHDRWASLALDMRYAMRRLSREPLVTSFILATLALGIGANLTAFSLVDRLLLRGPADVRDADRLVRVYRRTNVPPVGEETVPWMPFAILDILRNGMRTAKDVEAYRIDEMMVGDRASARLRRVGRVSDGMFAMLGTRPLMGRFFSATDGAASANSAIVLNERIWRNDFAASPDIIGKTIQVRGVPRSIIGIAPADFSGPQLSRVDAWMPIDRSGAGSVNWVLIARLRSDVSMGSASADAAAALGRSLDAAPTWMRKAQLLTAPIRYDDGARESIESVMARWLAIVSGVILLIACANVINLLLARIVRRRREFAIRIALGSGRAGVSRLVLLEGLLLAIGGALASVGVMAVVEPVVRAALFPTAAWTFSFWNLRVLGGALLAAAVVALVVGLLPAIEAGNPRVTDGLRNGDRGGTGRSPLRTGLTVAQAALSVVLLIGAGLFLRSSDKIRQVDLGVDADRVMAIVPTFTPVAVKAMDEFAGLQRDRARRLLAAIRAVPGIAHATVSISMPLANASRLTCFGDGMQCGEAGASMTVWPDGTIDSIPARPEGGPFIAAVADDYFATIGTRLVRGRGFTPQDHQGTEPVVVVGETMARTAWPRQDAIGKCIRIGAAIAPCARIVGIAADVHRHALHEPASLQFYVPFGQESGLIGAWLLARAAGPHPPWESVRRAMFAADPALIGVDIAPLSAALDTELRPVRLGTVTFAIGARARVDRCYARPL